jgi:DNA-binding protein YbaB
VNEALRQCDDVTNETMNKMQAGMGGGFPF